MYKYFIIVIASTVFVANSLAFTAPNPISPQQTVKTQHDIDYDALVKDLNVRKRQHLVFCTPKEGGLEKIDSFLESYPNSKHAEEIQYLAAIARWNLYRYADAAIAYQNYLQKFPNERLSSLAITRLVQSLIRSDQSEEAIAFLDKYKDSVGSQQREFHRADALALLGRAEEAKTHVKSLIMAIEPSKSNKRVIEVANNQLERLKLIGNRLPTFDKLVYGTNLPLTPKSFEGQVLLVDFWASWCGPCMNQMPALVDIYNKHHETGFEILGISLDSNEDNMNKALQRVGATWPQYFDGKKWENDIAVLFDVHRIPMTILVNQDGKVRAVDPPPLAIKRLVNELMEN